MYFSCNKKQDEYIKQLASKFDLLTTYNKMLESEIAQQANSSSTPPSTLPSQPLPNPKEHCNVLVLRSGKHLKAPKGARIKEECEKGHDEGIAIFPSKDQSPKKNENERSTEPKTLPQSLTCPLCYSHKYLLWLSLILNLLCFLMCLRSFMQ